MRDNLDWILRALLTPTTTTRMRRCCLLLIGSDNYNFEGSQRYNLITLDAISEKFWVFKSYFMKLLFHVGGSHKPTPEEQ